MKRLFEIILLLLFLIHFIGNIFPNMVGVPLAAYHSQQAWKEVESSNHSNIHSKKEKQKKVQSSNRIKTEQKDSLIRLETNNEAKK